MEKKDALQDFFKAGLDDVSNLLETLDTFATSKDDNGKTIYNSVNGVLFSLLNDLTKKQTAASTNYINFLSNKTKENHTKAMDSIIDMTSLSLIVEEQVERYIWKTESLSNKDRYQRYLKTRYWKKFRKKALKQAGYKCQLCASKKNLHVHHNSYDNLFWEENTDVVVLCNKCHAKFHDKLIQEDSR